MDDSSNHAPTATASQEPEDDLLNALAADADAAAVVLSDKEKLVLQLYQQVRELELERSLLEAQQNDTTAAPSDEHLSDDEVAQQLIIAERAAMEARASYLLRNKITDQVLITDPVIKAVHAGSTASFEERNAALAGTLLSLADPGPSSSTAFDEALATADPKLRDQLLEAERDAARARRRWRGIKGVVAGVVVGSGVDWVGDERLRELVLEEDEDELADEGE
ncbi:hypothetical protein SLS58_001115 [Diplodia intermedia]|uniref:Centromere protein H C-terminal domain-containing protein n=1 Tax=Diplodia intermedia TaxID=856260 RepID=A0ABR3U3L6_9PEZI